MEMNENHKIYYEIYAILSFSLIGNCYEHNENHKIYYEIYAILSFSLIGNCYEHNENHKIFYIRLKKENDPVRETGSKGREHDKKKKCDPAGKTGSIGKREDTCNPPFYLILQLL